MKFSKTYNVAPKTRLEVEIRLNDECGNGHDDFAITGTLYEGKRDVMGGCIHDEILKADPSLQIFVDLHLHDNYGAAMFCVSNSHYHLTNGKPELAQKSLMLTDAELAALVAAKLESEDELRVWIHENGLPTRWKAKADKAIAALEAFTGEKYDCKTYKPNYKAPSPELVQHVKERRESGYYTDEAKQKRADDAAAKAKQDDLAYIASVRDKAIREANEDYLVKAYFINRDMPKRKRDNIIYYRHINTITFNYSDYSWCDCITPEEFEAIRNTFSQDELPEGVILEYKA